MAGKGYGPRRYEPLPKWLLALVVALALFVVWLCSARAGEVVQLSPQELQSGAAEIRARGFSCDAITRVTEISPLLSYRVDCGASSFLVLGQVEGLRFVPKSLVPIK